MGRAAAPIDLGALRDNVGRLRSELGEAELCAVVKADAYGHGAVECARAALEAGAGRLAVATAAEASELARALPGARLLTMGALTGPEVDPVLAAGSEVAAWRGGFLDLLAARARALGVAAKVHVKLDSGMGRLGNRDPAETIELARRCAADPDLELAGVWTHFATADEPESGFFGEQLTRFAELAAAVRAELPGVTFHAANSAAVFRDAASHFDMARCGVALYGLDPFQRDPAERGLRPVLSLRSHVADVKRFDPGDSAGYGRTWAAVDPVYIGVVPLGYGDGVRRGLSNDADVLVGGRRRPLVGTVSMDNVTIEIGPTADVEPGAEAVLIGDQAGERILAEELARRLGTINYEITCGISARVPRVYE